MKPIRVLLVDDHQIITDGIKGMLQGIPGIDLLGSTHDGQDAIRLIRSWKPDLLITDISMPGMNGIEVTRKGKEAVPELKVLVLTMYTFEDFIFNAIQAGANGVLAKQDTTGELLLNAIQAITRDEDYFSPSISKMMMHAMADHARHQSGGNEISRIPSLTMRETEILRLYVEGCSNHEIGERLHISSRTVEAHKNNIMQKFNFKSTVEMVKFAIRNHLVSID